MCITESKLSFNHGWLGTKSGSAGGFPHPGLNGLIDQPPIGDRLPPKDRFLGGNGGGVRGSWMDNVAISPTKTKDFLKVEFMGFVLVTKISYQNRSVVL